MKNNELHNNGITSISKRNKIRYAGCNGFTLIEIIAVLSILAVLASLSLPKFINLGESARQKALESAVSDLNTREFLEWNKNKISDTGWFDDEKLFSTIDYNLGPEYHWSPKPSIAGGILHFKNTMSKLQRTPSTASSAARWVISKISTKST